MHLVDMHCHLDLMANGPAVAAQAATVGLGILNAGVTPDAFRAARAAYANAPTARCAAGLHPWWIDDGRCGAADVDLLVEELARTPFVGEVGLDFAARHRASAPAQTEAFERIAKACADHPLPKRLLTIHAVHAASTVLDILERYDLTRSAACIIHWFSGTSDELARARRLGCLFSVNEFMLATCRGREYARQIPTDRLLFETDLPSHDGPGSAAELMASLERTLATVAALKRTEPFTLANEVCAHSCELLDLHGATPEPTPTETAAPSTNEAV